MRRDQKGRVAEIAVLQRLAKRDLDVFSSVFDGSAIDFISVDRVTGSIKKIQVKWLKTGRHGAKLLKLEKSAGRKKFKPYQSHEVDLFVGFDGETGVCYVFTFDEVKHLKTAVSVSEGAQEAWHKLV
ncbi:MAG: hypothetical protein E6R04_00845 [Spirochaetes bacterium]|nr:MAG: hypothetical protein E6R04_00845 [Spirochaetota bacterium]